MNEASSAQLRPRVCRVPFGEGLGFGVDAFDDVSVGDAFCVLMMGIVGDVGDCSGDCSRLGSFRGRMISSGDGDRVDN